PSDEPAAPAAVPRRTVVVESPLFRHRFSNYGARLESVELLNHRSLRVEGPVELIPENGTALSHRVVVGADTLDLSGMPFEVSPEQGLRLAPGGGPENLTFTY